MKGQGSSFIWQSIWQAKEELGKGFRWVVGNGQTVVATKDAWLQKKVDFKVERHWRYEDRDEVVASFFYPGTTVWDASRVYESFNMIDAKAILATSVPQHSVEDRIVWSLSTDGIYSVKTGYHYWRNHNVGDSIGTRSSGWNKLWRLSVPNKVKIFLWRFCRNNLPVRNCLRHKGIRVTIMCPMCNVDVEHLGHVFFDCNFAKLCWQVAGFNFDMSQVLSVSEWLLNKLEVLNQAESTNLATVLWGIWFWRNKKVWEEKVVSAAVAMEVSFMHINEWREARIKDKVTRSGSHVPVSVNDRKWCPPPQHQLKLNVDASVLPQADNFSIGMVIRDHRGQFVEARVMTLPCPGTVLEAESIGVREALSWVMQRGDNSVVIETDSLLTVSALQKKKDYLLEVGHVLDQCKDVLVSTPGLVVKYVRKQGSS